MATGRDCRRRCYAGAMAAAPTLEQLRRYAVARTLFAPTTLPQAIRRVQTRVFTNFKAGK